VERVASECVRENPPAVVQSEAASESIGAVEYGEDAALRDMRAYCPVALVLCLSHVDVVAVHITEMVAGVR
jgi:hypothetical protein